MGRHRIIAIAAVFLLTTATWAGGPPPMYVVVDKVVLEPSGDAPDRIRIEGSFIRLENAERYEYGKPVHGYMYLSIEKGKEKQSRAEWAVWHKAAGTGKVISFGSCRDAGTLLTAPIRKVGEKVDRPDAAYSTEFLGRFGSVYVDGDLTRSAPVRDLLAFVKGRKSPEPATRR